MLYLNIKQILKIIPSAPSVRLSASKLFKIEEESTFSKSSLKIINN